LEYKSNKLKNEKWMWLTVNDEADQ
jgi:hypothetical protein